MQLSENDKTLILAKKENIQKITTDISVLLADPMKNRAQILIQMNQIVGNLSDLNVISNYLNSEPDLHSFRVDFDTIQMMFEQDGRKHILRNKIERFCNHANSIRFYEKCSIFPKIEIKIKNFHLHLIEAFNNLFRRE